MFGASAVRRGSGPQGRRIDQRHTASSRYGQTAAFETTDHGNVRHNSLHSVGSPTPSDAGCRGSRRASALRPGETAEQARLRRIEERDRLNKGVVELKAAEQYDAELQTNQLVVLYVDSLDHATVDPTKPPPDFEWSVLCAHTCGSAVKD